VLIRILSDPPTVLLFNLTSIMVSPMLEVGHDSSPDELEIKGL
jgi:hypothetical protein